MTGAVDGYQKEFTAPKSLIRDQISPFYAFVTWNQPDERVIYIRSNLKINLLFKLLTGWLYLNCI